MIDVDLSDYSDRKMNINTSDYMPIKLMQQTCSFVDYEKVYLLPLVCDDFVGLMSLINLMSLFIETNS